MGPNNKQQMVVGALCFLLFIHPFISVMTAGGWIRHRRGRGRGRDEPLLPRGDRGVRPGGERGHVAPGDGSRKARPQVQRGEPWVNGKEEEILTITPCITRRRRCYVLHNTSCTGTIWKPSRSGVRDLLWTYIVHVFVCYLCSFWVLGVTPVLVQVKDTAWRYCDVFCSVAPHKTCRHAGWDPTTEKKGMSLLKYPTDEQVTNSTFVDCILPHTRKRTNRLS